QREHLPGAPRLAGSPLDEPAAPTGADSAQGLSGNFSCPLPAASPATESAGGTRSWSRRGLQNTRLQSTTGAIIPHQVVHTTFS
uniref:Uncharacterized protein n=1 Tax=Anser cygnoides TaxID=8845 RepID=A0A8B9DIU6_ANSCY